MVQAIKEHVITGPGGRIEIQRDDLPAGAAAEVIIMIEQRDHAEEPHPAEEKAH